MEASELNYFNKQLKVTHWSLKSFCGTHKIDGSGSVVAFHLAAEYEWKITLARPQFMRVIVRLSENNFMAIYALRALIIGLGIFTDFKACCERLTGEWFYVFGVRSGIQRSKWNLPSVSMPVSLSRRTSFRSLLPLQRSGLDRFSAGMRLSLVLFSSTATAFCFN